MRSLQFTTYATRYAAFAVIATAANLLLQEATVRAAPFFTLFVSITVGTVGGFVVKYVLDKNYIFFDPFEGRYQEARKVTLYGVFSVLTTIISWAFEIGFWHIWGTSFAKYSGAILGLAIGYVTKFALDSRYTFRSGRPQWS
ncbi:GtrA family protein [Mesorhizobium escarrei]|uniref:GtrA-like protein n=1 Tax=Mesorhizobium escarrei TaxID=666018 RepID=A0ABN8KF95_9HYPH|nr:GtrA family protein [Mesorhizobium escarrei]CAH2407825.1 GtrA-like protein [Mesorhizobium escarrei]